MKKQILTLTLLTASLFSIAQTKPDTVYLLHERDVQRIYQLMQAGYQGAATSNDFSVNQRSAYMNEYRRIDSVIQPQYKKFHPVPIKKP